MMNEKQNEKQLGQNITTINLNGVNIQEKIREIQEAANITIFRPVEGESRIEKWIRIKMINYLRSHDPYTHRFMRIHHYTKSHLIHPILRFIQRRMRGYAIEEFTDIPAVPWNNHIRMFRWCWEKSLDDFWTKFVYCLPGRVNKEKHPTEQAYIDNIRKSRNTFQDKESHARRLLLINLWITEILEDTADREWLNMFMLRMYHELHKHYGGKVPYPGQQPLYDSGGPFNPNYFMAWNKEKLWVPDDKEVIGKINSEVL